MKLWAWDIETLDWDKPLCAVAVSEDGDRARFYGSDCLEKMCDHMRDTKGCYVAHYGGGFDVPLMLNVHKFRRIVLAASNILCAEDSRDLKLRDSYPWFLSSLAKIGKAVGLEKSPDVDRTNLGAHTQTQILDYCERDCEVLLRGVLVAQNFLREHEAQQAWTAGASAVSLLRALEPGTWHALQRCRVSEAWLQPARRAARGGRVECWARGRVEGVYSYDFKSSYPARYANRPLCAGVRRATRKDQIGVWRCTWVWERRGEVPPALDSVSQCGVGRCEAWLIDDEIAAFEARGVKVHRHEGFAPETVLNVGHVFLAAMFEAKESGGAHSAFAKVWLNSLHGKLGEDPDRECFTTWRPSRYLTERGQSFVGDTWWRYFESGFDSDGFAPPHCQPIASALVLGRARVALYDALYALQSDGWDVYYCDTDSVHTNCPPDKMPLPLGNRLGDLALEAGPCEAIYLGPKAYLLRDSDGEVVKSALKGVPLKNYASAVDDGGVIRESLRARPGREAESGRDLRVEVFERALAGEAKCAKGGISSFLTGLTVGRWGARSVTRTIKPSGQGKVFGDAPTKWAYLSQTESLALAAIRRLPLSLALWERVPLAARRFLYDENDLVRVKAGKFVLTPAGSAWYSAFQTGDMPSSDSEGETDDG